MDSARADRGDEIVGSLLADLVRWPAGQLSPSVYETGRLVSSAPWLVGHERRQQFLVDTQRPDGRWGAPDGYWLVPTLSATEALLTVIRRATRAERATALYGRVVAAARQGLMALLRVGRTIHDRLPGTRAAHILILWLVAEVNRHLAATDPGCRPGFGPVRPPSGTDPGLAALRRAVQGPAGLPAEWWHYLEVLGRAAERMPGVRVVGGGVGCSPAATVAWLGRHAPEEADPRCVGYLTAAQETHQGPVAGVVPATIFERARLVTALADVAAPLPAAPEVTGGLHGAFTELGVSAGEGLPPDCGDTAVALLALVRLGRPRTPECLLAYETDDYFRCFLPEGAPSVSTNAHVLAAFGDHLAADPLPAGPYRIAIGKITRWLSDQQRPDGSWTDKWHASPYYPTVRCATALARHSNPRSMAAVRAARNWILATQRPDGSWGRWEGTSEETAYAVQTLVRTSTGEVDLEAHRAALRGHAYLVDQGDHRQHPPLWQDKDLYAPIAIIRAEVFAATRMADATRP